MGKSVASGTSASSDPDDAPELTAEFFDRAEIRDGDKVVRRGRPPTGNAKAQVTIRLDQDVLAGLRAKGQGWQTIANAALRSFLAGATAPAGRPMRAGRAMSAAKGKKRGAGKA